MIEEVGNLWTVQADARIITTNGDVNSRGLAVMGRGVAAQAAARFPSLKKDLGHLLSKLGNQVLLFQYDGTVLLTMPVKHHWYETADGALIVESARELEEMVKEAGYERVAMPRPGCGNGRLKWADVRELISFLPDTFVVVNNEA